MTRGRYPNATCQAKKQRYLSRNMPARRDPIPPLPNIYEELWIFDDDFFHAGGNSRTALRLVARLKPHGTHLGIKDP
ncbi:hypothetical protein [Fodinicola acaciae]|uniref:hypothetical protein n=1 Tax=Fodinicola acaciae TaxID=2681555 RepID=UPI0013D04F83|nr:hypothetical protein [Fodinicola acaciae]